MLRFSVLVMTVATGLAAAPASADYLARNGLVVIPGAAGGFAVPFRGESGAAAFWCAAGDFARHVLRAGVGDRIRRLTPVPRKGGQPMRFAMGPGPSAGETGLALLTPDDGSLSVAFAYELCSASAL